MGQLLVGGRGGARLKYNLFVQPDEPETKDGLWIQTPSEKGFRDVVLKNSYVVSGYFATDENCEFPAMPQTEIDKILPRIAYYYEEFTVYPSFKNNSIYFAGKNHGGLFKYNLVTNIVTKVFYKGLATGDFILFMDDKAYYCNNSGGTCTEVYDIGTDTVISSGVSIFNHLKLPILYKDTDYVYAFDWNPVNGTTQGLAKISINTNTVTYLDNRPAGMGTPVWTSTAYQGHSQYGDNAYIFTNGQIFVFNHLSETWTVLDAFGSTNSKQLPAMQYGGDVFISNSGIWRFNLETQTLSNLTDYTKEQQIIVPIPGKGLLCMALTSFANSSNLATEETKQLYLDSENVNEDSLCLLSGNHFQLVIINLEKALKTLPKYSANIMDSYNPPKADFSIDDAWYYDSDFREYPTYIGDGTTWNKIKN